jgi:predicted transcriptional regulator
MPIAVAHSDSESGLDEAQRRVVEDFGQLFARYGLTLTFGRVFGLLLISDRPLSLDDIATQLGVSKSGTSVAARDLERLGIARRLGTLGSRRALYEASDNLEPIFEAQFARVRQQLSYLQRTDALLPPGRAKARLRTMMDLHLFWLSESEGIMSRWRQRMESR